MKTKFFTSAFKIALCGATLCWLNNAQAANPASVNGTWRAIGNQTSGPLVINQAAGTAFCNQITGNIFGNPIEGYYCPKTGRIVFSRKLSATGKPFQLYKGFVARGTTATRIGGSFLVWNADGGRLSAEGLEYNFRASK